MNPPTATNPPADSRPFSELVRETVRSGDPDRFVRFVESTPSTHDGPISTSARAALRRVFGTDLDSVDESHLDIAARALHDRFAQIAYPAAPGLGVGHTEHLLRVLVRRAEPKEWTDRVLIYLPYFLVGHLSDRTE